MEREMGDVGTHFLYENEHVKAWDLELEPGQASSWRTSARVTSLSFCACVAISRLLTPVFCIAFAATSGNKSPWAP